MKRNKTARANAKQNNQIKYYTGVPCKLGHNEGRYTVTGRCVICSLTQKKQHYRDNKEHYSDVNKEYYRIHKDTLAKYNQQYRDNNEEYLKQRREEQYQIHRDRLLSNQKAYYNTTKEEHKNRSRIWRSLHPVNLRKLSKKYIEAKRLARPSWFETEKQDIIILYKKRDILNETTNIAHHVDHIVPLQGKNVCGLHCLANLRIITAVENSKKSNRLIEDLL